MIWLTPLFLFMSAFNVRRVFVRQRPRYWMQAMFWLAMAVVVWTHGSAVAMGFFIVAMVGLIGATAWRLAWLNRRANRKKRQAE